MVKSKSAACEEVQVHSNASVRISFILRLSDNDAVSPYVSFLCTLANYETLLAKEVPNVNSGFSMERPSAARLKPQRLKAAGRTL